MHAHMVEFASLAARSAEPIAHDLVRSWWALGDAALQAALAARTDLPYELHKLAAHHDNDEVRAAFVTNDVADDRLLTDALLRFRPLTAAVLARCSRVPETVFESAIGDVEVAGELLLGGRLRGETKRRAVAAYATRCESSGVSAARQFASVLREEVELGFVAVSNAGSSASSVVHGAVLAFPEHQSLLRTGASWVLRNAERAYGEHRRDVERILQHLGATLADADLLAALVDCSHAEATRARLARVASLRRVAALDGMDGARACVTLLGEIHLSSPEASMLARSVLLSDGVGSDPEIVARLARLPRQLIGPLLSELSHDDRVVSLYRSLNPVLLIDSAPDPWAMLDSVDADAETLTNAQCVHADPMRALQVLRPLRAVLDDAVLRDAAVRAVNNLLPDTAAWECAAVLLSRWEGTLPELLDCAVRL